MSIKDSVLQVLERNRGIYVSGEALSGQLGVTRQYIWKAVKSLIAEGYEIDSSTNRGYKLGGKCDLLSAAVISSLTGANVFCFEEVASTNSTAKERYFASGECIVAAERQTDGVKKDGSPFPSPKASGVYMTAAIEARISLGELQKFRESCADVVKAAIERAADCAAEARNVDDIYVNGKKVCGILTECMINAAALQTTCAFIGIGIYTEENPELGALGNIESSETRNALIADIYNGLKKYSAE